MIRIITGIYGYRNPKTGTVEAKTAKSEPFSCSSSEEERLVGLKVAEYVKTSEATAQDEDQDDEGAVESMALESMTKKQLLEVAEQLGIEAPKKATNQEIIALIEKAQDEHDDPEADPENDPEDDDQDDEGAPVLSASMPE